MNLLVWFKCVQVLVPLLLSATYGSYGAPWQKEPPSSIDLYIDPVVQSEHEDLEDKRVVVKSVFNIPVRPQPSRCPPGHEKLANGDCAQLIRNNGGVAVSETAQTELLKEFFSTKRKPSRNRHRTPKPTTTTTQEIVPTTEMTESNKDLSGTESVWILDPGSSSSHKGDEAESLSDAGTTVETLLALAESEADRLGVTQSGARTTERAPLDDETSTQMVLVTTETSSIITMPTDNSMTAESTTFPSPIILTSTTPPPPLSPPISSSTTSQGNSGQLQNESQSDAPRQDGLLIFLDHRERIPVRRKTVYERPKNQVASLPVDGNVPHTTRASVGITRSQFVSQRVVTPSQDGLHIFQDDRERIPGHRNTFYEKPEREGVPLAVVGHVPATTRMSGNVRGQFFGPHVAPRQDGLLIFRYNRENIPVLSETLAKPESPVTSVAMDGNVPDSTQISMEESRSDEFPLQDEMTPTLITILEDSRDATPYWDISGEEAAEGMSDYPASPPVEETTKLSNPELGKESPSDNQPSTPQAHNGFTSATSPPQLEESTWSANAPVENPEPALPPFTAEIQVHYTMSPEDIYKATMPPGPAHENHPSSRPAPSSHTPIISPIISADTQSGVTDSHSYRYSYETPEQYNYLPAPVVSSSNSNGSPSSIVVRPDLLVAPSDTFDPDEAFS